MSLWQLLTHPVLADGYFAAHLLFTAVLSEAKVGYPGCAELMLIVDLARINGMIASEDPGFTIDSYIQWRGVCTLAAGWLYSCYWLHSCLWLHIWLLAAYLLVAARLILRVWVVADSFGVDTLAWNGKDFGIHICLLNCCVAGSAKVCQHRCHWRAQGHGC